MSGTQDRSWLPSEIVHMRSETLPLATRIQCDMDLEDPKVTVAFLADGEWTATYDWWQICRDASSTPRSVAAILRPAAREELEERGWELLSQLGYIPNTWLEAAACA